MYTYILRLQFDKKYNPVLTQSVQKHSKYYASSSIILQNHVGMPKTYTTRQIEAPSHRNLHIKLTQTPSRRPLHHHPQTEQRLKEHSLAI